MPSYYKTPCPACGGRVFRQSSKLDDGLAHRHRACGGGRRNPGTRPACRVCGEPAKNPKGTYCSPRCAGIARQAKPNKVCELCGKSYRADPSRMDRSRWCSVECQAAGRIRTGEKWARNRGLGHLPWSSVSFSECRQCGELFAARRATRRYCSEACYRDATYAAHLEDARTRNNELYQLTRELAYPHEAKGWRHALHKLLSELDGNVCALCFEPIDLMLSGRDPRGPTVEHLVPRSAGGGDELENLALSHWECNAKRGAKPIEAIWEATG